MKDLGIYIHIPFCNSKCYYCDFVSFPHKDDRIDEYIEYLLGEIKEYKELLKEYIVKTIFIGGGTPSYIGGQHIGRILEYIYKNFNVEALEEVTIETNPGTLNREKLKLYKEYGINRISIGVQSLNDNLLKNIGRVHTSVDFYRNFDLIRNLNFKNVNVDLMFGLPNQTMEDCKETLEKITKLDIEHISYYSLILEENTLMDKWYKEGKIRLPEEETERDMYHFGINFLKDQGYKHYEISNFAKDGLECKHNLFYWQLKPYIGFGLAAHSNLKDKRYWNYSNFKDYYNSLDENRFPIDGEETINREMAIAEYLIMGLRLIEGVNKNDFFNRFKIKVEDLYEELLIKYKEQGLLYIDDEWIRFTPKGLDLSNIVYVDILP
ncbi:Oxygen-independent coproporphyrinogen III oxidase [[Clostridium] ultunense Esp]|uniref:Heme chaperone HemW n=1 Tax=[Clostridium] ultunense Esp TaxID=1288971 RepID=M1ZFR0_9FIRM|nr:radical SAM family heme chaperone HemW [Schnuerera ultunensis]CCQ97576.1 Oxygen-independent coproporphyrinogen III oxidase [[Clostridium] ultunense Esp]SHD77450.1 Oxygen-independent coproporphyrinogen III oxidase [[Clostridium] ultunense Esp]